MMPGAISLNSGASTPPAHHLGGGGGVEILKHTTPNLSTGRSGYVISFSCINVYPKLLNRPGILILPLGGFRSIILWPY